MPRGNTTAASRSSPRTYSPTRVYSSPKSPVPYKPYVPQTPSVPTTPSVSLPVEKPGFFSNMWQGFGLGAGQAIAHNIFRSNPVVHHVHDEKTTTEKSSNIELSLPKDFVQCMKDNNNDNELCNHFLESYFNKYNNHLNNNI
jgi:hypothetical protein